MEPQRKLTLEVAGLRLRLRCAAEGLVMAAPRTSARPFIGDARGSVDIDLLVVDSPAPLPSGRCIFDTGDAWSVHEHGPHWLIRLDARDGSSPLWTVILDRAVGVGILHPGPALLAPADGELRLVHHLLQYPLDQILLMLELTRRDGLLVHAAGCEMNGTAVVFPGVSGAGKSTLTRLLHDDPEIDWLSDDRMALRAGRSRWLAGGTPWPGDAGIANAVQAPLGALCFLAHSDRSRLEPLSPPEALHRLLPVASIPWFDAALTSAALDSCQRLVSSHPCYLLHFRRDAGEVHAQLTAGLRAA